MEVPSEAEASEEPLPLLALPANVLQHICCCLTPGQLCIALTTCRQLAEAAGSEVVWKSIAQRRWQRTGVQLGPYTTWRECVLDDNLRQLLPCVDLAGQASTWRYNDMQSWYQCQLIALQWWRHSNHLMVYLDVRGEVDLRHPLTSSLALVELAAARVAAAQLRAHSQRRTAAAGRSMWDEWAPTDAPGSAGSSLPAAASAVSAEPMAGAAAASAGERSPEGAAAAVAVAAGGGSGDFQPPANPAISSSSSQAGPGATAAAAAGLHGQGQAPPSAAMKEVLLQLVADRSAWTGVQLVELEEGLENMEVFEASAIDRPGHIKCRLRFNAAGVLEDPPAAAAAAAAESAGGSPQPGSSSSRRGHALGWNPLRRWFGGASRQQKRRALQVAAAGKCFGWRCLVFTYANSTRLPAPEVVEEWEPAEYVDYTTAPLLLVPPGQSLRQVLLSQPRQASDALEQALRVEGVDVQRRRWAGAPTEVQERQGWWQDGA